MKQYVNVARYKSNLLVREIVNGQEVKRKVKFSPHLYQRCNKNESDFKDFFGGYVKRLQFDNQFEMKEYVDLYSSMENELWGTLDIIPQFIFEEQYDTFDLKNVKISSLDIEVCTRYKDNGNWVDGGFPNAHDAAFPINAICDYRYDTDKYYVFTTAAGWSKEKSILKYSDQIEYIYCSSELQLVKKWINFWCKNTPHIITGWNVLTFDIPYIINRIKFLFTMEDIKYLSPWQIVNQKQVKNKFGEFESSYDIVGIAILDYIDLYKKYRYKPREKYTLDYISRCEIPEEPKLEFEGTHGSLYYDNPVYFVDYNVHDVRCVNRFENKMHFIDLVVHLSYYANINFADNYSPIKIWENLIYKRCMENGIATPMRFHTPVKQPYEGAYVHDPKPGLKGTIASFDYTSLYPKIMEQWYIGSDVHITGENKSKLYEEFISILKNSKDPLCKEMLSEIQTTGIFLNYYIEHDIPKEVTEFLQKKGVSLAVNCEFYDITKKSQFVGLITQLFNERKSDKKKSFEYAHKAEDIRLELEKRGIKV